MNMVLKEAVVVAYGRSAIGKAFKGTLKTFHPVELGGQVLSSVLDKLPLLDRHLIQDVIVGCARPEEYQGMNLARMVALRAGLPYEVCGQTINRFCSSGLQAVATAANVIMTGQADVMVAGGVESMSLFPTPLNPKHGNAWLMEHQKGVFSDMGTTAENVADRYQITRDQMDRFGLLSQTRATAAQSSGILAQDIVPLTISQEDGSTTVFDTDEGVRPGTTLEGLSKLRAVFREGGRVTAGNSSQISDAAAFVVLMCREKAEELGIRPLARFLSFAVGGVDPAYMGMGPITAVPKVMAATGLTVADMDVIELNEAFAAQAIPCMDILKMDPEKVNPNGGAIALGHPTGATGSILLGKAITQLQRTGGRYALITMCIGGGMGAAAVIERLA